MPFRIRAAWRTDRGRVRISNEDAVGARFARGGWEQERRGDLFVVCDGMGGHAAGEVAARLAVQRMLDGYFRDRSGEPASALTRAVQLANRAIQRQATARTELRGMGCTCVAAAVCGTTLTVAHVGDSRAYLLRGGELRRLTEDHSWVGEQVRAGVLAADEAAAHPMRNVVTRALGVDSEVEVATTSETLEAGDVLLLCSDGLSGPVKDAEIAEHLLAHDDPGVLARRLVAAANAAGGPDNVTVLVARAVPALASPVQPIGVRRLLFLGLFGLACAAVGFFAGVGVATAPALPPPQPAMETPATAPALPPPQPAMETPATGPTPTAPQPASETPPTTPTPTAPQSTIERPTTSPTPAEILSSSTPASRPSTPPR